jgi:hypothetical protein
MGGEMGESSRRVNRRSVGGVVALTLSAKFTVCQPRGNVPTSPGTNAVRWQSELAGMRTTVAITNSGKNAAEAEAAGDRTTLFPAHVLPCVSSAVAVVGLGAVLTECAQAIART